VRVLSSGNSRKNDELDALATALAASRNERLASVDPEAASEALRLLSERREDLVAERTRALNRLHALLRDLLPGGVARTLSADRAARILRGLRPKGTSARLRRRLASEVLRDIRTLDRKIADLNRRIEAEVEASEMADGDPIIIGKANTASNPGNETSLSRNEVTNQTVFVARNLNAGSGIHGEASGSGFGVFGISTSGIGVLGLRTDPAGVAGFFDGGITVANGDLTVVNGNKFFKIDHPLDPKTNIFCTTPSNPPRGRTSTTAWCSWMGLVKPG
jgi:hypothetical protein